MQNQRQSNIELLRIIAITMVLILHFNVHGWNPDILRGGLVFSWSSLGGNLVESFSICAVNVFVLISGYFAIKLSVKSVLNLYIRCFIIGLITYLAYLLIAHEPVSITALAGRVLAFTHNHWWFVISYLGLMAISPILNAGCEALDKRTFQYTIVILTIFLLYFGWGKYLEKLNDGYSLIHFIYLYIVARYLKLHVSSTSIRTYRWLWLGLFVVSAVCLCVMSYSISRNMFTYDNPIVVLESLFMLQFFLSIPFYNRFVNWAAASVFSAYLIQESPYFGYRWIYPTVSDSIANGALGGGALLFALYVAGVLVLSILIDQIIVVPIIQWSNRLLVYAENKRNS